MNPVDLRVYAIVGPEQGDLAALPERVAQAVAGGATLVQYRDKTSDTRRMVEVARALRERLRTSGVPLLVNDRIDVALAAQADGVHIGQDDMRWRDARALLGPGRIIGLTVQSEREAAELPPEGIDYACIGGVFATTSKTNKHPPVGLAGLTRIAERARLAAPGLPLGAIAGIDATNAAEVVAAGVDGVAVISAIFAAPDAAQAARRLRVAVDTALAIHRRTP